MDRKKRIDALMRLYVPKKELGAISLARNIRPAPLQLVAMALDSNNFFQRYSRLFRDYHGENIKFSLVNFRHQIDRDVTSLTADIDALKSTSLLCSNGITISCVAAGTAFLKESYLLSGAMAALAGTLFWALLCNSSRLNELREQRRLLCNADNDCTVFHDAKLSVNESKRQIVLSFPDDLLLFSFNADQELFTIH